MPFFEDPRIRQFWNHLLHNAEIATENTAAGIWAFHHEYIHPCLGSVSEHIDQCTSVCLGDREERARRQRERERAQAENSFDFYDDWARDEDELGNNGGGGVRSSVSGILGSWSNDDWDRLLVGTGSAHKFHDGVVDQPPKKKRDMNYGTRRWGSEEDSTVIPSTQSIGILGRLPWRIGRTLRYKPSAADLKDRLSRHDLGEREPLIGDSYEDEYFQGTEQPIQTRVRRNTTGSGATSGSYRSRGDLLPSDGEGDEDAVPLGDEFTVDFDRSDDRSSNRTRSSKGKYPAGTNGGYLSRTVSRSTVASGYSAISSVRLQETIPKSTTPEDHTNFQSMEDVRLEEENLWRLEEQEIEVNRRAALKVAFGRGLHNPSQKLSDNLLAGPSPIGQRNSRPEVADDAVYVATTSARRPVITHPQNQHPSYTAAQIESIEISSYKTEVIQREELPRSVPDETSVYSHEDVITTPKEACPDFVPARLPYFT
ncbi:hypothetical protein BROUX41_003016 [Berkeleyomyces rouxiae]|uniref:uncharacterized protein n=1 Tax=Berkeleyomyces rouxiae TaxID=2035830 RepID=UPI003B7DBBFC